MKTHNLVQGSPEWEQFRNDPKVDPASEAPAMCGKSKYKNRIDYLTQRATGIIPEVTPELQRIFDKGHENEAAMRPVAAEIIGEDIFPMTVSEEYDELTLSASLDGGTMVLDVIWEHKSINDELRQVKKASDLSPHYTKQMDQQLMITGAEKCLFMASDGTPDDMVHVWYKPNKTKFKKLLAEWRQFHQDLEDYKPPVEVIKPEAAAIMGLPALNIRIAGEVRDTNLEVYKERALDFIGNINTELATDQDFVDAEANIKFCSNAEKELKSVKNQALGQMATIDDLFKTVDFITEEMRQTRLKLEKLVKSEKERRKGAILGEAEEALRAHYGAINETIAPYTLRIPFDQEANFRDAINGKKTLESMQNAVDTELARVKVICVEQKDLIVANREVLDQYKDYIFLFKDADEIIRNEPDYFDLMVQKRVSDYERAEKERVEAERERIRQEEAEKLREEQAMRELLEQQKRDMEAQKAAEPPPEPPAEEIIEEAEIISEVEVIDTSPVIDYAPEGNALNCDEWIEQNGWRVQEAHIARITWYAALDWHEIQLKKEEAA